MDAGVQNGKMSKVYFILRVFSIFFFVVSYISPHLSFPSASYQSFVFHETLARTVINKSLIISTGFQFNYILTLVVIFRQINKHIHQSAQHDISLKGKKKERRGKDRKMATQLFKILSLVRVIHNHFIRETCWSISYTRVI